MASAVAFQAPKTNEPKEVETTPSWVQKIEKEEANDTRKQPWRAYAIGDASIAAVNEAARTFEGFRDLVSSNDLHKVAG